MKWKIGTLLVVGVATITVGLSLFVTGYWSTEISESSGAVAAVSESEGDDLHDGIKAHGEYEIEVRDPDGTLVAKRVVPNAVTSGGKNKIASILFGGSPAPFAWVMKLEGSPAPCAQMGLCVLGMGDTNYTEHVNSQYTLKKSLSGNSITFSGSYIAGDPPGSATTAQFNQLFLYVDGGGMGGGHTFSAATISPSVSVAIGQTINLTYTLTIN